MKVSEFEAKLGTVSDAKLRQMLAASREHGPEVAVELILAEGRKRGLADWDLPSAHSAPAEWSEAAAGDPGARIAMATSAYPKEGAGAFGSDAPEVASPAEPGPGGADRSDGSAPALAPEWLAEETKSGLPLPVKILLFAAVLGGGIVAAWKFYH